MSNTEYVLGVGAIIVAVIATGLLGPSEQGSHSALFREGQVGNDKWIKRKEAC